MIELAAALIQRVDQFRGEAVKILATHETSTHRLITIEQTRRKLQELSPRQQAILDEAITCVEKGLHRAAHVLAWAAAIDNLEEILASDGLVKVRAIRPKWDKCGSLEEMREYHNEDQLLDVAKDLGLIGKTENKVLHGHLAKRNQCAHPSDHSPDLNESLGYISDLLAHLERWSSKSL